MASNFSSRGRGHASVEASILGIDMLEDQGQSVFLILEEDFETILGIKLLARFEPGESWLFTRSDFALMSLEQCEDIFGIWNKFKLVKKKSTPEKDNNYRKSTLQKGNKYKSQPVKKSTLFL